jgi:two-component system NtrC family response regulator
MARVLIIDDDDLFCEMVAAALELSGHEVRSAGTAADGQALCRSAGFDVIFLDIRLPDGNGLELIPAFGACPSEPEIIIITAAGDPHGAEMAIGSGAWDYLSKPSPLDELQLTLTRALRYRKRKAAFIRPAADRQGIVGSSPRMQACIDLMAEFAPSDTPVLVTGETGTGKELFARALHRNSRRTAGPFVAVDCASIPKNLIESELFGHEKGAFTGAVAERDGVFAQAHGGTLFLDEVGELPLSQQKAFLRVLQERTFRRVGGKKELYSDFRLVAATNKDLPALAERGEFRADLLFRLQAVLLHLPPLRDRGRDIYELALYHVEKLCLRYKLGHKELTREAAAFLEDYPWPGNVRELVHVVEQAVVAARRRTCPAGASAPQCAGGGHAAQNAAQRHRRGGSCARRCVHGGFCRRRSGITHMESIPRTGDGRDGAAVSAAPADRIRRQHHTGGPAVGAFAAAAVCSAQA